jgi:hypothetical protein
MGKDETFEVAYNFLVGHAKKQTTFTFADIAAATKWRKTSWETYRSKQLKEYITRKDDDFSIKKSFARLTSENFRELFTQVRKPVAKWKRATYGHVVSYEFLLPLTREDKLRAALDELFYRDTLDQRTSELELEELVEAIPRTHGDEFNHGMHTPTNSVQADILLIRTLFFHFFVEAVARSIQGEDVIWLLESSPSGERVYALEKAAS